MGIHTSIQRFVDNLDIHSRSYLLLLIFQGLLIIAIFYVKQKVFDFQYTVHEPALKEITIPHNQVATFYETDFVFLQTD